MPRTFASGVIEATSLIALLLFSNPLMAQRDRWLPSNEAVTSAFLRHPHGYWIEKSAAGFEFRFEEVEQSEQFVLIEDPGRKMQIRLLADHAELRTDDKPFGRWKTGKWVVSSELPSDFNLSVPDYKIRILYFIPSDRTPTKNYQAKITTLMNFVASLYRHELQRRGLKDAGLKFEMDGDKMFQVHIIHGKQPAARYNDAPAYDAGKQWDRILPDIPGDVASPTKNLMIVFAETYDSGPAKWEWPGGIALGARFSTEGGCGIFSAWILQDEFCATNMQDQIKLLNDSTPIPGRFALGHGRIDSPRFEFIEDGFGAVAHELGHAVGLPHDTRIDDRYIMGNGFRNLRINLNKALPAEERVRFSDDNALLLTGSRFLNPNADLTDARTPEATLTVLRKLDSDNYLVKLKATDDKGLKGAVFFDQVRSSVIGGKPLQGKNDEFTINLPLQVEQNGGKVKVSVEVIDHGGNIRTIEGETNAKK